LYSATFYQHITLLKDIQKFTEKYWWWRQTEVLWWT